MRKHRETAGRRQPRFESLETRHLLSAGPAGLSGGLPAIDFARARGGREGVAAVDPDGFRAVPGRPGEISTYRSVGALSDGRPGGLENQSGAGLASSISAGPEFRVDVQLPYNSAHPFATPPILISVLPRGRLEPEESGTALSSAIGTLANNAAGAQGIAVIGATGDGTLTGREPSASPGLTAGTLPLPLPALAHPYAYTLDRPQIPSEVRQQVAGRPPDERGIWNRPVIDQVAATTIHHLMLRPPNRALAVMAVTDDEAPAPRGADLIASTLPVDGASLEEALDRLARELGGVDLTNLVERGPAPFVVASVVLFCSAASVEMTRRLMPRRRAAWRGVRVGETCRRQVPLGFPELPGSWSEKRV
jgi:hypothetical protein